MKNIIYLVGALLLFGMISCYEDLGNYSYGDKQTIRVDSLQEEYTGYAGDSLKITPVITSGKEIIRYEWSVYSLTGAADKTTVLNSVKDLRYSIVLPQDNYRLLFKVTDIEGYVETVTSTLSVRTVFSEGFYVLKEVNSDTDLDLYPTGKGKGAMHDLFFNLHGSRLQGKPVDLVIAPQHQYFDSVKHTEFVLYPVSEQESPMVKLQNMQRVFNFKELFYNAPADNEKPLKFIHGDNLHAVLTDKHAHSYATYQPVSGRFGAHATFDTDIQPTPYVAIAANIVMFYDNLNGQFLNLDQFTMLSRFKNTPPKGKICPVDPYGLNCEMIYMRQAKASGKTYALLKHKESEQRYLFELLMGAKVGDTKPSETNPVIKVDTLAADLHIAQADHFTVSENSIYLYYTVGGQLYVYNIAAREESPLNLDTGGEEITMINYLYWLKMPISIQWHYFIIATHTNGRYKVYRYKTRGDLPDLSQPPVIYEGEGKAKAIHYTTPLMNTNQSWYPFN